MATPASTTVQDGGWWWNRDRDCRVRDRERRWWWGGGGDRGGDTGSHAAPEIDPSLLAGGLALLIGGTFVLLGQRRPHLDS